MKKKLVFIICFILIALSVFVGCVKEKGSSKISVVATLFPQYDFIRQIAGEHANVTLILPAGAESHSFEPTAADIIKINSADLFVYTGDVMEPWAKSLLSSGEISGYILNLSDGLTLDTDEHDGDPDPHVWTDPQNAILMVKSIASALSDIDAENKSFYEKNAEEYIKKLEELDKSFEEAVNSAVHKEMVFASDFSLHYFAKRYGLLHMAAFDSCGEETEPSAKTMAQIINHVRETGLKYIWCGELESTKTAEAIASETGAEILLFHSCHNVTKDEFLEGATYLSLMKNNLENIRKGLY